MLKFIISIFNISLFYSVTCSGSVPQLTAHELISKYSENNRYCQLQVTKSQTLAEYYMNQQDKEPHFNLYKTEFRRDGERWEVLETTLRELKSKGSYEAEFEQNMRRFWDGKLLYDSWFFNGTPENIVNEYPIIITHKPNPVNRTFGVGYYGAPFEGILTGDIESLPVILTRASKIGVRENKEFVGDSECYVIDARGQDGKYTIWIDPEHGYNIVQADVEKEGDDYAYGKRMGDVATTPITGLKFGMKNVRLEQIQGHWIPMEGDFFLEMTRGNMVSKTKNYHKRINIDLNPDFEEIGAFVPNIPNGTKIRIMETPMIHYVWKDGKPVADISQDYLKDLDKSIENTRTAVNSETSVPKACSQVNVRNDVNAAKTNDSNTVQIKKADESNAALNYLFGIILTVFSLVVVGIGYSLYGKDKGRKQQ